MTALEIKQLAESYIEEFIEDRDAVFFLNLCLNEIGDQALVYETAEGDILNPNEWYVLPETTTHVRKVEKNGKPYYDYEILDNRIRFKHPGTYTIHYRRHPRPLQGILDTPDIHPAYHHVLAFGLIARWKLKDDDENPDGIMHLQLFRDAVMRTSNILRRTRTPDRVKVIR